VVARVDAGNPDPGRRPSWASPRLDARIMRLDRRRRDRRGFDRAAAERQLHGSHCVPEEARPGGERSGARRGPRVGPLQDSLGPGPSAKADLTMVRSGGRSAASGLSHQATGSPKPSLHPGDPRQAGREIQLGCGNCRSRSRVWGQRAADEFAAPFELSVRPKAAAVGRLIARCWCVGNPDLRACRLPPAVPCASPEVVRM
jgi:hypothetical protein